MEWTEIAALIIAGLMVGFINTLAGGGSIISLSVLIMLGLPAPVANGTNRIAIALQTLTATASFKHQKVLPVKKAALLAIPTVVGAVIGAWIAVDVNEATLEKAIGIIMLVMLFFVIYKPQKFIYGRADIAEKPIRWFLYIVFFFIGLYAGFLHMGVGYFFLMAIVGGAGFDLVKANAVKVFIILAYAPFTILVFLFNDQINWAYGLVLAVGNICGAIISSRLAVSKGVVFVKWVIIIVVLLTAGDMFGMYDIKSVFASLLGN